MSEIQQALVKIHGVCHENFIMQGPPSKLQDRHVTAGHTSLCHATSPCAAFITKAKDYAFEVNQEPCHKPYGNIHSITLLHFWWLV